jgi:hypothetical protein
MSVRFAAAVEGDLTLCQSDAVRASDAPDRDFSLLPRLRLSSRNGRWRRAHRR